MTKKKPVQEIRLGNVRAAVWQNALENGRTMYSVRFSRLFKEEGEWRDSNGFGAAELPLVAQAAEKALEWVDEQPKSEKIPTPEDS